jgi:lipopolysaccharide/colanic/teichoic acid biosynthesis glycosyltransferase
MYPIVMIAIWIEDGRPFFFGHKRESIGGREFFCWKFRSMRKDAEQIKAQLKKLNQADGPQFYIENDPRLTRVGRFLRKYNLDEFPQFWSVLLGDMSWSAAAQPAPREPVLPRQREARLSVRPSIWPLADHTRRRE